MSDTWIILIPENAGYVPPDDKQALAKTRLREFTPNADEVVIEVTDNVRFVDCGQNFERIFCPECGNELELEWWQEKMGEDYAANETFQLSPIKLPCCGVERNLHGLRYECPAGFAKFSLTTKNPNIGKMPDGSVASLEGILDCPLRVIYSHL